MIVQPDIFQHPKFIALRAKLGPIALEILAKIWGHSQQSKKGAFWSCADSNYLEVVCVGRSKNGKIFNALCECGWISKLDGGIEIKGWNNHNGRLLGRWNRDDSKPEQLAEQVENAACSQPVQASEQPPVQASEQPPVQASEQPPVQTSVHPPIKATDKTRLDKTRLDSIRVDGIGGSNNNLIPSLDQAMKFFKDNGAGYTDDQVKSAYDSFQATRDPGGWWKMGKSMVTDWRSALSSRIRFSGKNKESAPQAGAWQGYTPPIVPPSELLARMKAGGGDENGADGEGER